MKDNRPVNLSLTTVKFPITAIASILHRISGVVVWVGLGLFLAAMGCALYSPESFAEIKTCLTTHCFAKFALWGLLSALAYHSVATLKHVVQDLGYFEDFAGGKMISWASLIIGAALSIWVGVAICL